jgi:hypothetical protein
VGSSILDQWSTHRLGRVWHEVRIDQVGEALPPIGGLRYLERSSGLPLGGRVAPHLRHVEGWEAVRLLQRADRLLDVDTRLRAATIVPDEPLQSRRLPRPMPPSRESLHRK